MDTGSIMQNQMDDMISQGEALMEEIVNEALEIYKEHKVTPEQLLEHNKRLTEALELLNNRIDNYWNNGRTDAQAKYICQSQIECGKLLNQQG